MSRKRDSYKLSGTLTSIAVISALFNILVFVNSDDGFCSIRQSEAEPISENCGPKVSIKPNKVRYILYGVSNSEGFNLRRDVYMRIAVFVNELIKDSGNWKLVLPPWNHLYHWQSKDITAQFQLPWNLFFDVESLKKYVPVLEFYELFDKLSHRKQNLIDRVFVLQHFKDTWSENKLWEDKWVIEPCLSEIPYAKTEENKYTGPFWRYTNVTAGGVDCVSFQGPASQLSEILKETNAQSVMFDHAEVALHNFYGQAEFWKVRRSMRFAKPLIKIATDFREMFLNSTDENDGTLLQADWTKQEAPIGKNAKGGPYLAVHLRRKDFLWGRSEEVPTIDYAALQIRNILQHLKLKTVFIATDAPGKEFQQLKSLLDEFVVYQFEPTLELKNEIKDGGVAIVDQIICSHAAFFTGTHESTFSFRIQEEREILGFDKDTTFNRLCGKIQECVQPTRWGIVY